MAANAISANTRYHFVHAPDNPIELMSPSDVVAQDAQCAVLDPEKDMTLSARDEDEAVDAFETISQRIRDSHSTSRPYVLDCSNYAAGDARCAADVAKITFENVSNVELCESPIADTNCWKFVLAIGDEYLELQLFEKYTANARKVMRVVPAEMVTISDARED
jgi:hypothetical protein